MRDTDRQLKDILERSENLKNRHADIRKTVMYSLSMGVCLILLVMTAVFVPSVIDSAIRTEGIRYGSLILSAEYMGYIIMALLAFILGILATLFCFHLNEIKRRKEI